jgi:protein-(glutamine-N5) methyltransferase, release factor-specific
MFTYKELLQIARKQLKEQKIADAELDAWYLLSHVCSISRTDYLLRELSTVPEEDCLHYMDLINMRAKHIPLQYITGYQEFMGLEFKVSPDVLIPRQDTELLAEEVLKCCKGKTVLDMCTGSGCIIISAAKLGEPLNAAGADISEEALKIAAQNAAIHGVEIELIKSDMFEQVSGSYDIIVSNPPYIRTRQIKELMPEVKNHEPFIALDGKEDGLYFYRCVIAALKEHLNSKGSILFEIGYDQGEAVKELLYRTDFTDIVIKKDLSGLDRVVRAVKP